MKHNLIYWRWARAFATIGVALTAALGAASCSANVSKPGTIANAPKASASTESNVKTPKPAQSARGSLAKQAAVVKRVYTDTKAVAERCLEADIDTDIRCRKFIDDNLSGDVLRGVGFFTPVALGMEFVDGKSVVTPPREDNPSGKRIQLKLFLPGTSTSGYEATARVVGGKVHILTSHLTEAGQRYYDEHQEITGKWLS